MNKKIEFPDYALRGLSTENCVDDIYGYVTSSAFVFDGNHYNENNCDEISINWYDKEEALVQMKEQKKNDSIIPKYSYGIGRIPTSKIKLICNKYKDGLFYERKPVEGNEFHGNLLLHKNIATKTRKHEIAVELAMCVDMLLEYHKVDNNWSWKNISDY